MQQSIHKGVALKILLIILVMKYMLYETQEQYCLEEEKQ